MIIEVSLKIILTEQPWHKPANLFLPYGNYNLFGQPAADHPSLSDIDGDIHRKYGLAMLF